MSKPQVIFDDSGTPAFAVIPWQEYERMRGADASLTDEELYDRAKAEGGESFPIEVVDPFWPGKTRSRCTETIAAGDRDTWPKP